MKTRKQLRKINETKLYTRRCDSVHQLASLNPYHHSGSTPDIQKDLKDNI